MSFTSALTELRQAQKPRRGVSLYSRFLNRPLGRVLAAACYSAGMSPNQVTALSAIVTAAGLASLIAAPDTWWRGILAAALFVLGFALDSADGQVARLSGRSSPAGEWLDHVVDAGKIVAVHAAVLVSLYLSVSVPSWVYVFPLVFQVVAIVMFAGGVIVELLVRASAAPRAPERSPSTVRAVALLPADYGILAISFLLFGWPAAFLTMYVLLLIANTVIMIMLAVKWFRSLKSLGRS